MGTASHRTRRVVAGLGLAVVVAAGVGVSALLPDTTATDITGDALYAVAAYLAVVLVAPALGQLAVAGIAAGWCIAVELFQLTNVPLQAGAVFPPASLLLGTVFDTRDLLIYAVTVVLCASGDVIATWATERIRVVRGQRRRDPSLPAPP